METKEILELLKNKKIRIIPYSHCDYSWVHTRLWHINRYCTIMREALDLLDNTDEYRYYVDCFGAMLGPVLERHPEYVERLRPHIRSGRFAICGSYANIRPNMVNGEAFVRNMVIGRRLFLSYFPEAKIFVYADSVDVIASHTQLPQLLQKGGYTCMRVNRPQDVLKVKKIPLVHNFVGQDGSRILVSLETSTGIWNNRTIDRLFTDDIDASIQALYEDELKSYTDDQFYPSGIVYKGNSSDDNVPCRGYYPDRRLPLVEFVKKWREAGLDIEFATPNDVFEARKSEKFTDLAESPDICDVPYNLCLGGERSLQSKRLTSAEDIIAAEKFSTIIGKPADSSCLWMENLFVSCHASQWAYKEDYADLTHRVEMAAGRAQDIYRDSFTELTRRLRPDDRRVWVVFNTHDMPVRRAVTVTITTPDPAKLVLVDGYGRRLRFKPVTPFKFEFMHTTVWEWDFLVMIDVPAHGYNSIIATEGALDVLEWMDFPQIKKPEPIALGGGVQTVISNDKLKLTFTDGRLLSIKRAGGGELSRGDRAYNELCFTPKGMSEVVRAKWAQAVVDDESDVAKTVTLTGTVGVHPVTQTISLYMGVSEIHIDSKVDWQENSLGMMTANVPCDDVSRMYGGIPFGTEGRNVEREPYKIAGVDKGWDDVGNLHRTIDGLYYCKNFFAFREGGEQLAFIFREGDRHCLWNRNTNEVGHILNCCDGKHPDSWYDHINDVAFTSFGIHNFRYVLAVADAAVPGWEMDALSDSYRAPVMAVLPLSGGEQDDYLPDAASLLATDHANVRISAFYEDSGKTVLRIWEAAGTHTNCTVHLPFDVAAAAVTDFNGVPDTERRVTVKGSTVSVAIGAHEIVTLQLEKA